MTPSCFPFNGLALVGVWRAHLRGKSRSRKAIQGPWSDPASHDDVWTHRGVEGGDWMPDTFEAGATGLHVGVRDATNDDQDGGACRWMGFRVEGEAYFWAF